MINKSFELWELNPRIIGIVFDDVDYSSQVKSLLDRNFCERKYQVPNKINMIELSEEQKRLITKSDLEITIQEFYEITKIDYDRIFSSLKMRYNPIENTDRYESERIVNDGRDTTTNVGTDTTKEEGTKGIDVENTNGTTSTTLVENEGSGSSSIEYGKIDLIEESTRVESTHVLNNNESNQINHAITKSGYDTTIESKVAFDRTEFTDSEKSKIEYNNSESTNGNDVKVTTGTNTDTDIKDGTQSTTSSGADTTLASTNDKGTTTVEQSTTEIGNSTELVDITTTSTKDLTSSVEYGKSEDRELHVHGNIGVTSNVELLNQEISIRVKHAIKGWVGEFINTYTFY